MEPAVAGAVGGGLVVLGLGLALALFIYGRATMSAEIDALTSIADDLRSTLDAERRQARIRAAGSELDMARALALAGARARGDLAGVLRQFDDDDGPGSPPGEPGDTPEPGDDPRADSGGGLGGAVGPAG